MVNNYLCFEELMEVLNRLGLPGGGLVKKKKFRTEIITHILKHGLHQCNSNLRLLDKIILGILDI